MFLKVLSGERSCSPSGSARSLPNTPEQGASLEYLLSSLAKLVFLINIGPVSMISVGQCEDKIEKDFFLGPIRINDVSKVCEDGWALLSSFCV